MLRKRAPNPSLPWHRAHLFMAVSFRRTLVSCLRSNTKLNDCLTCIFWTTTCIFWTAICGFVLWDRNQSVQGAIVRENDADRNSRTCLAARSARRDDSRRGLGRDRAKEAAKMNLERAPCSES